MFRRLIPKASKDKIPGLKCSTHAHRHTHAHTLVFRVVDEASAHDVPIQTVCLSERTTSGHQITSLSKHEAFNRCETPGPGSFHTNESQLKQKNKR